MKFAPATGNYNVHLNIPLLASPEITAPVCCIWLRREGKILISETEFSKNKADINGGAIITWCEMRIEKSRLINNHASIYGGAINNQKKLLTLKNCELLENNADTGGAIFDVEKDNLKTDSCKFRDNALDDIY